MSFILSIDQGTTGTTAALISAKNFELVAKVNQEYTQIYPQPGWVEHNLNEIWSSVQATVQQVLKEANVLPAQIQSIGITNQRETTCAFNREGHPMANAIVWQDRRTSAQCQELRKLGHNESIKNKTGLPLDPYFSATKMQWLLKNNEQVQAAKNNDQLLFGTIDTFLLYKLTGHRVHATEASNASRTLLYNLKTSSWDDELMKLFEIPSRTLPTILDSFTEFGKTQGLRFLPDGIPITGILGDQQAALYGQAGLKKGDMKCTYGTGAFLLMNTERELVFSQNGLLTTVAYRSRGEDFYALEGSCYIAGAAVQWVRDNLHLIQRSPDIESLAAQVKNLDEMKNILFLPFFTGLGSPYWEPEAKGTIIGLTRDTSSAHIARACLEGIALSIHDLIKSMEQDSGLKLNSLRVDGGAVQNDLLLTIQATISELEIIRPQIIETTAFGAALASAVGSREFSAQDITKLWKKDESFHSNRNWEVYYQTKKQQWGEVIKRLYLN